MLNQIVEELKIYKFKQNELDSRRDLLAVQNIISDTLISNSGELIIPAASTSVFYELRDINYIYLSSIYPFNLVLNDIIVLTTRHFSYLNIDARIHVSIQSAPTYKQTINYAYGSTIDGDEYAGASASNAKYTAHWDKQLKNVIFTVRPEDTEHDLDSNNCDQKTYLSITPTKGKHHGK